LQYVFAEEPISYVTCNPKTHFLVVSVTSAQGNVNASTTVRSAVVSGFMESKYYAGDRYIAARISN
jgi:hypothetical protein